MCKLLPKLLLGLMIVTPKVVAQPGNLLDDVKAALAQKNFTKAQNEIGAYRAKRGVTPDLINAIAWMGRGALAEKQYDKADVYAAEARKLAIAALKTRKLDREPQLPLALGASFEVHSQVLNARGQRAEAIAFLRDELKNYRETSIAARIQKNINLLSLEGKPAPALELVQWLRSKPVPLAQLKGHPVLLFFWAHWCSDCKAEVSTIQRINATYGPQGLVVVGPTQHYGYVAGGVDAPPDRELLYIDEVRKKYYARIGPMSVPVSERNFTNYGASTTPTLVLIDRAGIVRLYNPGNLTYEELAAKIEQVLGNKPQS